MPNLAPRMNIDINIIFSVLKNTIHIMPISAIVNENTKVYFIPKNFI